MYDAPDETESVTIHKLTVYVHDHPGQGVDEAASYLQQQLSNADFGATIVHEGTKQVDKRDLSFRDRAKVALKILFG